MMIQLTETDEGLMVKQSCDRDKVLLVKKIIEGEPCKPCMMRQSEIFDMMDMSDCYDISIEIWDPGDFGCQPKRCFFKGKWTHMDHPRRMEIVAEDGTVLSYSYGTDH